jgi:hypothetical protein
MRIRTFTKHTAQALAEGGLIALLVVGAMAGTAFAGKPPSADTSSSVRVDDGVFAGTTTAYQGSSAAAWVRAACYQNGSLVFEDWRPYDGGTATISLGPTPNWSSGAADCTAQEGSFGRNNRWRVSSSTTFHAAAS